MTDERRSSLLGTVLVLILFGVGLWIAAGALLEGGLPLFPSERKIAVIPVEGVIGSAERTLRSVRRYRDRDDVRGFVVEIRSPGGSVGGSQSLYHALRELREEEDRPVYAWIGDVGASGGYYVALAADSIFALPGSITGSIGVIMELPNAQGLLRKAGLELEVVKSGAYKDLGSPVRPLEEGEREVLQGVVDDTYRQFLDVVVENRGMERERAVELADGRIFTGSQAVELGLVDGVATLSETIDRVGRRAGLGDDPPTVTPSEPRPDLWDVLLGRAGARWLDHLGFTGESGTPTPRLLYQWR